jgi:hypothetical protein
MEREFNPQEYAAGLKSAVVPADLAEKATLIRANGCCKDSSDEQVVKDTVYHLLNSTESSFVNSAPELLGATARGNS